MAAKTGKIPAAQFRSKWQNITDPLNTDERTNEIIEKFNKDKKIESEDERDPKSLEKFKIELLKKLVTETSVVRAMCPEIPDNSHPIFQSISDRNIRQLYKLTQPFASKARSDLIGGAVSLDILNDTIYIEIEIPKTSRQFKSEEPPSSAPEPEPSPEPSPKPAAVSEPPAPAKQVKKINLYDFCKGYKCEFEEDYQIDVLTKALKSINRDVLGQYVMKQSSEIFKAEFSREEGDFDLLVGTSLLRGGALENVIATMAPQIEKDANEIKQLSDELLENAEKSTLSETDVQSKYDKFEQLQKKFEDTYGQKYDVLLLENSGSPESTLSNSIEVMKLSLQLTNSISKFLNDLSTSTSESKKAVTDKFRKSIDVLISKINSTANTANKRSDRAIQGLSNAIKNIRLSLNDLDSTSIKKINESATKIKESSRSLIENIKNITVGIKAKIDIIKIDTSDAIKTSVNNLITASKSASSITKDSISKVSEALKSVISSLKVFPDFDFYVPTSKKLEDSSVSKTYDGTKWDVVKYIDKVYYYFDSVTGKIDQYKTFDRTFNLVNGIYTVLNKPNITIYKISYPSDSKRSASFIESNSITSRTSGKHALNNIVGESIFFYESPSVAPLEQPTNPTLGGKEGEYMKIKINVTPLQFAILCSSVPIINLLIQRGSDYNIVAKNGMTLFDLATTRKNDADKKEVLQLVNDIEKTVIDAVTDVSKNAPKNENYGQGKNKDVVKYVYEKEFGDVKFQQQVGKTPVEAQYEKFENDGKKDGYINNIFDPKYKQVDEEGRPNRQFTKEQIYRYKVGYYKGIAKRKAEQDGASNLPADPQYTNIETNASLKKNINSENDLTDIQKEYTAAYALSKNKDQNKGILDGLRGSPKKAQFTGSKFGLDDNFSRLIGLNVPYGEKIKDYEQGWNSGISYITDKVRLPTLISSAEYVGHTDGASKNPKYTTKGSYTIDDSTISDKINTEFINIDYGNLDTSIGELLQLQNSYLEGYNRGVRQLSVPRGGKTRRRVKNNKKSTRKNKSKK